MALSDVDRDTLAGMCLRDSPEQAQRVDFLLHGKEVFAEPDPDPIYGGVPRIHRPDRMFVEYGEHPQYWSAGTIGHPLAGQPKRWPVRALVAELTGRTDLTDDEAAGVLRQAGWTVQR